MAGLTHTAPAGKSTVIAGSYRALWNDLDIGLTMDGFTLTQVNTGIDITADITGETVIDTIYSGTSLQISMTLENWNAQAMEPMIWWMGANDRNTYEWGVTDGVGQRHWDAAAPLILYACQGYGFAVDPSPADITVADVDTLITPTVGAKPSNPNIDPLDIVFPKTLLQKDSNLDIKFSFEPRFISLTLDVFPISNNYDGTLWSPDAPDSVDRVSDCSKIRYFTATRGTPPA